MMMITILLRNDFICIVHFRLCVLDFPFNTIHLRIMSYVTYLLTKHHFLREFIFGLLVRSLL